MKIAIDHQAFVLQKYGGISRYFVRLACGLVKAGHEVNVFAAVHRNAYLNESSLCYGTPRYLGDFPPSSWRLFNAYSWLVGRHKIGRWRPDLVHETYYSRSKSASRNFPSVITVYDMIHELYSDEMSVFDTTRRRKKLALHRASHIISISENTRRDLINLYEIPEEKISVISLGFDVFTNELSEDGCAGFDYPFLLYVGIRSGYKNFKSFVRAVARSKKLKNNFRIVAFGGGEFTKGETKEIKSLGFSDKEIVHVSGDDRLLGSLYRKAAAFVYPSLYEGFGIPPLEAMAHNCPVVCSNTSSIPEVVGTAAEFFNPNSEEDIGNAIESVVLSGQRANELRQLGKSRLNRFSWSKCIKQTLDIYQKFVCRGEV